MTVSPPLQSPVSAAHGQACERVMLTVAISGMTCAACPASILHALEQLSFIEAVDINLLNKSAKVTAPRGKVQEIVETIEDTGYDAQIATVQTLDLDQSKLDTRIVQFMISGPNRPDSVSRLKNALESLQWVRRLEFTESSHEPVTVEYAPMPPHNTVRSILEIAGSFGLKVELYEAPSISTLADHNAELEIRKYLICVLLNLLAAIPTFIIGICIMDLAPRTSDLRQYFMAPICGRFSRGVLAMFLMATPIQFGVAMVFHKPAVRGIRGLWTRRNNGAGISRRLFRFGSMNLLVSLGITIAYFSSLALLIISAAELYEGTTEDTTYFDSVVFLCLFILCGRYLEVSSKKRMKDAVKLLGDLKPCEALLVGETGHVPIASALLEIGDHYLVPVGASPPVDGRIIDQETFFDESCLSGESRPVKKAPQSMAFSGTINVGKPVIMEATNISGSSVLDSIIELVIDGTSHRAPIERFGDILTAYFVPVICLLSVVVFAVWLALAYTNTVQTTLNSTIFALRFSISLFVIACPCGIGLAAPTAAAVGSGMCAKLGILASGGSEAFSEASNVRAVVFDKTGTITLGTMQVTDSELAQSDALSEGLILSSIAALEQSSTHPIAKAIRSWAARALSGVDSILLSSEEVQELPGQGLRGKIRSGDDHYDILTGNERLMMSFNLPPWKSSSSATMNGTRVHVAARTSVDASFTYCLILNISDPIREEAQTVITQLRTAKIDCYILTGDNSLVAHQVARDIGIDDRNVIANVLPMEKQESLLRLKAHYAGKGKVVMVGDGINDAAALASADVSVSLSSATDVAMSSASFILISSDLKAILTLLRLSKLIYRRIQLNFVWAILFNMIAIPIAAGVLYPHNQFILSPAWSSLAMALSSISVVLSSFALLLHRPKARSN